MLGGECAGLKARLPHLQTPVADRIVDCAEDEFGPALLSTFMDERLQKFTGLF